MDLPRQRPWYLIVAATAAPLAGFVLVPPLSLGVVPSLSTVAAALLLLGLSVQFAVLYFMQRDQHARVKTLAEAGVEVTIGEPAADAPAFSFDWLESPFPFGDRRGELYLGEDETACFRGRIFGSCSRWLYGLVLDYLPMPAAQILLMVMCLPIVSFLALCDGVRRRLAREGAVLLGPACIHRLVREDCRISFRASGDFPTSLAFGSVEDAAAAEGLLRRHEGKRAGRTEDVPRPSADENGPQSVERGRSVEAERYVQLLVEHLLRRGRSRMTVRRSAPLLRLEGFGEGEVSPSYDSVLNQFKRLCALPAEPLREPGGGEFTMVCAAVQLQVECHFRDESDDPLFTVELKR